MDRIINASRAAASVAYASFRIQMMGPPEGPGRLAATRSLLTFIPAPPIMIASARQSSWQRWNSEQPFRTDFFAPRYVGRVSIASAPLNVSALIGAGVRSVWRLARMFGRGRAARPRGRHDDEQIHPA
ncbi:hypothetical protein ABC974_24475 [Sphingomonas oligophenolica]|uniref:Uncharacterized protein n=1 Tax=Sphingomonas oligophenolica TaxID=301154 RepID=A0ABU9YAH4_9SPHN